MNHKTTIPSKYFLPLLMNGLQGRMLVCPSMSSKARREILVVYGQNSDLDFWFVLVSELSKYGTVTMPDLPGMGGMESLKKAGIKPSIESLADYLASFIKLRFKRKRITIICLSSGFAITTKMLQKYPELVRRVDILFCVSGLSQEDILKLRRTMRLQLKLLTRTLSLPLMTQ